MKSKDWINDYKLLKQVNPVNPFTVPAGYFDSLGDRIVSREKLEELKNKDAGSGFTVPANYFDELTANIQSRLSIETAFGTQDAGFTVPAGYFDNLGQQIQSRIFIEEATGGPAEAFAIPDGYFENLNRRILDKTINAPTVIQKGIVRKLYVSRAFKYATAACFALAIGGGILISELTNPVYVHNHSFLHKQLSHVPVSDIKSYLQLNVDAGETQQTVVTEGSTVNDAELKNALKDYADSVQ